LTVVLNINKTNEEKTTKAIEFANSKKIKISAPKFRYSKADYTFDKEKNTIYKGVGSIKYLNDTVSNELYELRNNIYNNFFELLIDIKEKTSCNSKQLDILIKLDYFKEYGNSKKILDFVNYYSMLNGKKNPKKATINEKIKDEYIINIIEKNSFPTEATYTKFDCIKTLEEIWNYIPNESIDFKTNLINRKDILGYIDYKNEKLNKRYVIITDVDTKYTPVVNTYCLNNGNTCKCKISKKIWNFEPLKENDIIFIHAMERKFGHKKVGETIDKRSGKTKPLFEVDESKIEWWVTEYSIISNTEGVFDDNI
jgi:DNA polymerase III alpha subunit